MEQEIDKFDRNRVLSASTDDLTRYFYERYCVDPVQLAKDEMKLDDPPQEVMVDERNVPNPAYGQPRMTLRGVRYVLRVPFQGYADLFKYRPSRFTTAEPIAEIEDDQVVLSSDRRVEDPPERVRETFMQTLTEIEQYLDWVKSDLLEWLPALRQSAWQRIEARKRGLLLAQAAASRMGFKLKERTDTLKTFAAPEVRRRLQPPRSPSLPGSAAPYEMEPTLVDAEYEHILSLISSMAMVLERSPHAFATMDEESLRFLLLVPLNSHYDGQATGETFNFEGKTDILIRVQGKTIFIAECKIWGGKKELLAAIDQLLGYSTWRETKTAIVIFNRNKDFSAVLAQIRPVVEGHPKCKRFEKQLSETALRFTFKQRDDDARDLTLTVLLFNVPSPATRATVA